MIQNRHVAVVLTEQGTVDALLAPNQSAAVNDRTAKTWLAANRLGVDLRVHLNANDSLNFHRDDAEDYQLHPRLFQELCNIWTVPSIDRFASKRSSLLPLYNSRWADSSAMAVDAFAQDWSIEINYLFPPPRLIPRVMIKMAESKACGTIVFPLWRGAYWFHALASRDEYRPELIDWYDLPINNDTLIAHFSHRSIYTDDIPRFRMIAAFICCCSHCPFHMPCSRPPCSQEHHLPTYV
jgi:hypothetical protein